MSTCGRSSTGRASPNNYGEGAGSSPADRFPDGWKAEGIEKWEAKPWILNRHYAGRMPAVKRAYGLIDPSGIIRAVLTFGPAPNRQSNNGAADFVGGDDIETWELNRLVAGELPENGLSWFISQVINQLDGPRLLISYADPNRGHHGYVYQATNWIYTGTSVPQAHFLVDGDHVQKRSISARYGHARIDDLPDNVERYYPDPKHRYIYLVGNRRQVRQLKDRLDVDEKPYPKGDNERYDDSGTVAAQGRLFT